MKWYKFNPAHERMNVLPVIEDESGFSVDVLVFGYIRDRGDEYDRQPRFGIGYVNSKQQWFVHTVNGAYPNNDDPINEFVPLAWAYLPDAPVEMPPIG